MVELLLVATFGAAFYFIPFIVALVRGHHLTATIGVINLFAGWTFIGWVVAMAMAVGPVKREDASAALVSDVVKCASCGAEISRRAKDCWSCHVPIAVALSAGSEARP